MECRQSFTTVILDIDTNKNEQKFTRMNKIGWHYIRCVGVNVSLSLPWHYEHRN
jgi:hypothetical protein